jgi:integrase
LHFSEGYRERALITEEEFRRVIEASYTYNDKLGYWIQPVLLLLRRAGLRCGEASFLTPNDFQGLVECRLRIRTSKTVAGKRTLPLYLLLNIEELETVLTFVESVRREHGSNAHLVTRPDGSKVKPDSLGRLIVKLFRAGGVYGETAHGLRHAFASGLLAAWWLRLTGRWSDTDSAMNQNWARRALYSFGRPNVEGRAIEYADDIRRLLGHADLAVTFERYIHTLDVIVADAVQITERTSEPQLVSIHYAARLLCISERAVRYRFHLGERSAPLRGRRAMAVTLGQLEEWLSSRINRAL